jgi:hypothetical protein
MAPKFRRCYNRLLREDPKATGTIRVSAKIGPLGEVAHAEVVAIEGLPPPFADCILGAVRAHSFAPPDGGGATVVIPISFKPS